MACGLPIISSNKNFNDDILDDTCSIRIDTTDVEEIKNAILRLYDNKKLRDVLSKNAIKKTEKFNINERAKNIIKFMEEKLEK